MPGTQGTYDDGDPEEVRRAKEDAVVQYRLKQFTEAVVQCEISLIIATSLGNGEYPEDEEERD